MNQTNQKIIDAIVRKAEENCPDSLALIAVYGSVCTGDEHEKSDLDLLVVINDDNGRQLQHGFILNDRQVGYDLYCTTWEQLALDAECHHAHLSRLMDSKIIYTSDERSTERLLQLRKKASELLGSSLRYKRAEAIYSKICESYADAMTATTLGAMRTAAASMISLGLDMVMLWNGSYFQKGVKRTFEELEGLALPEGFVPNIDSIVCATDASELREQLTAFLRTLIEFTKQPHPKEKPSPENLSGTYEEMFSNWRNKMYEAAKNNDRFSSFMNTAAFQLMLEELSNQLEIARIPVMEDFQTGDLLHNAAAFDQALALYHKEYEKAALCPNRYRDVEEFVAAYLHTPTSPV